MTKKGSQQTTNAPVMMANVLAALRSRLDSMFRRRLVVEAAAATAAAATDVIRRVNLAGWVGGGCAGGGTIATVCSTYKLSRVSDGDEIGIGGRPRFKTPTAAAMTVQVVGSLVETKEIPVLLVVELVGAADETAPLRLSRNPPMAAAAADEDETPLFCLWSLRLLIRFLAVRKIRQ